MSVVDAVRGDLERLAKRDPVLASSGLAAVALALAEDLDGYRLPCEHCEKPTRHRTSAAARAQCAKELRDTLSALNLAAPAEQMKDGIDELKSRRENKPARRARAKR